MSGEFCKLIPDARAFFHRLAQDNSKDWWAAHRAEYEARLKTPAVQLLDLIAVQLGESVTPKLFRPYRDVRFSKDKTPYHLHLHMLWGTGAGTAYFFGISGDYVRVGAGAMGLDKRALTHWRETIAKGGALPSVIRTLMAQGYDMDLPELKRVPAPFPADHPQADLLRRKSCVVWTSLAPDEADLPGALMGRFQALTPLIAALPEG